MLVVVSVAVHVLRPLWIYESTENLQNTIMLCRKIVRIDLFSHTIAEKYVKYLCIPFIIQEMVI